jgi:hypothetical protein
VYVLPARPAFALAAGPWLGSLLERRGVQRAGFGLASTVALVTLGASIYLGLVRPEKMAELADRYAVTTLAPLGAIAGAVAVILFVLRPARGAYAWVAALAVVLVVQGFWINPMIDGARSGREFVETFERAAPPDTELGLVAYREQYLLYITRPITNFGHRRTSLDGDQEAYDAARWLNGSAGRVLVVDDLLKARCFRSSPAQPLGHANRRDWFLVSPPADTACDERGDPGAALQYSPFRR